VSQVLNNIFIESRLIMEKLRFKDDKGNSFPIPKKTKYNHFLKIPLKEKPDFIDSKKLISVQLHKKGAKFSDNTDSLSIGSTTYYVRKSGQFIYGKQNFFNGAFDILNDNLHEGLSSGDVPCLDIDNTIIDSSFFLNYIGRDSYYKAIEKYTSGTGSKRLHEEKLLELEIKLPIYREQEKIGGFLSTFDKLIQKQQDKIGLLKELKKGYLQKMFPKNDANVPEIRFKGFTDDWEQYKFSQILDLIKDGTHGTHQNVEEGIYLLSAKNIKNGEIVISTDDRKISESEYLSIHKNFQIKAGDILLTIVGTIGDCAILKEPNGITFQRSVAYLRPGKKVTSNFLYSTIMTAKFQNDLRKGQSISAQAGVYLNELGKIEIILPSIEEQKPIGSLFEKIDNLITLHQRKLDQLENLKKGYMQRLFA
jgi:restriction endonuclease S subunit